VPAPNLGDPYAQSPRQVHRIGGSAVCACELAFELQLIGRAVGEDTQVAGRRIDPAGIAGFGLCLCRAGGAVLRVCGGKRAEEGGEDGCGGEARAHIQPPCAAAMVGRSPHSAQPRLCGTRIV
jgi:hypothetical protein